jgi:DedD protein
MSLLPARGIHGVRKEFMAKAISDEELQLKKRARRRLVGAVALVLLIVVVLPMILDSEPKPLNQDIAITIPPIPKPESIQQNPVPAMTSTLASPSPPRVAGMPAPAPAVQPDRAPDLPTNAPAKPEAKPVPKPLQKHEIKPAPTSEESFVVQLGAFSNAANAKALQRKLQDNKFKAYTELVKNASGDRTRVRVGPYPTREDAEKARDRLKAMKLIIGEAAVVRRD